MLLIQARLAFKQLIHAFTSAPLLRYFDPNLPLRLEIDASKQAIRSIILQLYKGNQHPITFRLKKLTLAKLKYKIGDSKMLAIVNTLRTQRYYFAYALGLITVLTDYFKLRYQDIKKKLNRRQVRQLNDLLAFDLRIKFRLGKLNPADALLR